MTPPQEALADPAPDPAAHLPIGQTPQDLICPAQDIFDGAAIRARILERIEKDTDAKDIRAAAVAVLTEARKSGTAAIVAGFAKSPRSSRPVVRAYCWLTDCMVREVLHVASNLLHPLPTPTESERIALIAVGGYGRGEMAPHSDVDLLFLTPYKLTPWAESVIESMLYILWDLRLKVGHSSRTIRDCRQSRMVRQEWQR